VAKTIDLDASSGVQADQFAFQTDLGGSTNLPPPQRRTVLIIACVDTVSPASDCTTASGGSVFKQTAVATIDNFGTRPIRVYSWRAG
jgi:hypothetical protein